mgnify:CR=1 FL=1
MYIKIFGIYKGKISIREIKERRNDLEIRNHKIKCKIKSVKLIV